MKAIIEITKPGTAFDSALAIARQLDAGKAVQEADYHLSFSSAAQLFSELTPARLAILDELKAAGPLSIYALAKHVSRNYSNVHRDCVKLIKHELIEKDDAGRIFVPWDEVQIRLTLGHQAA